MNSWKSLAGRGRTQVEPYHPKWVFHYRKIQDCRASYGGQHARESTVEAAGTQKGYSNRIGRAIETSDYTTPRYVTRRYQFIMTWTTKCAAGTRWISPCRNVIMFSLRNTIFTTSNPASSSCFICSLIIVYVNIAKAIVATAVAHALCPPKPNECLILSCSVLVLVYSCSLILDCEMDEDWGHSFCQNFLHHTSDFTTKTTRIRPLRGDKVVAWLEISSLLYLIQQPWYYIATV